MLQAIKVRYLAFNFKKEGILNLLHVVRVCNHFVTCIAIADAEIRLEERATTVGVKVIGRISLTCQQVGVDQHGC